MKNKDISEELKQIIRDIPNFPKEDILFKDITPIFAKAELCRKITDRIALNFPDVDAIAGIESRGFFWGMSVAQKLNIPFVPIRKAGKLPYTTLSESYTLEYGMATIEIHQDAIEPDWKVLIHDDLLATGGTALAAAKLVGQLGKVAGFSFLVELGFLNGRAKLEELAVEIDTLVSY
ncbi:MAG: adenine phosphoribosyltransferase [Bacteroidota bacterium]